MNNKRLIVLCVSGGATLLLALASFFVVKGVRKHKKANTPDKETDANPANAEQANPDSAN